MRQLFFTAFMLSSASLLSAQNQPPRLLNLSASVHWPTHTLSIQYDVLDAENDPLDIALSISADGGRSYTSPQVPASGHVGYPVQPGTAHSISCDVSQWASQPGPFTLRLVADDRQPFSIQALVNEVDSNRLQQDLRFVEGIRHRSTGATHLAAVRDSVRHLFEAAGLYAQEQTFAYTGGYTGRNVIGSLPGTTAAEQVVLADAHYDSMSNAPGADDNGSGTVGVMELARLLSRYPAKKTLRFIGFDLEEAGLVGSTRYVSSGIPAGESIAGVFNFEMIGYYSEQPNSQKLPAGFEILFPAAYNAVANDGFRGNFITNVGNTASKPLIDLFANSAAQYVPGLKVISVEAPGNSQIAPDLRRSDHAPFWDTGRQALMLSDGANFRNLCYHMGCDTAEGKLNFIFMAQVVQATLASMAQLAEIQHGSWATTTFDGTVGTQSAFSLPCHILLSSSPRNRQTLYLKASDCLPDLLTLALYDERGVLLHRQEIGPLQSGMATPVLLPRPLPAGLYFARFSGQEGSWTERVMIP